MRAILLFILLCTANIVFAQSIKVGTVRFAPPFEMAADNKNHFSGFDIDLVSEICNRIKQECVFIPLSLPDLFNQTYTGEIDLAIASINITAEREQYYLFSLPYLSSNGQFLALATSGIKTINDLKNKTIGTTKGTVFPPIIQQVLNNQAQVIEYASQPEVFQALNNQKIDAMMLDAGSAQYWSANDNQFIQVGPAIPIGTGYGIMANKKLTDLIGQINRALLDMEADGTYLKIYNCYFNPKMSP